MSQFSSLDLSAPILAAVAAEGYDTPTPIQAQAIPPILKGRDLLGCAQTGTGKTAAFALPILHRLHTAPADKSRRGPVLPRALILSPTRELAAQIGDSFRDYGHNTGLRHTVVFGGVSQFHQVKALKRGVDILVATPGRLIDLMEQGHIDLREIEVFVLDEADRMLDMGFIQPIRRITKSIPRKRQTLLFSATMPKSIMQLADSLLHKPVKVAVTPVASAAPKIEQKLHMIGRREKTALLQHIIATEDIERGLVFTRTKHGADRLVRKLGRAGVNAQAIHGNKSQNQRQRALQSFKTGRSRILVATDVAARGLDVDGVSHVFNFDLPNEPEAYVHRIGRTGRAGATGVAISFCDTDERDYLRAIERLTGTQLTPEPGVELPETTTGSPPAESPGQRGPRNRAPEPRDDTKPRRKRRRGSRPAGSGTSRPKGPKKPHRKGHGAPRA